MDRELPEELVEAGYDPDEVTFIPRTAIHKFMVQCDAWLAQHDGLLMFVGADSGAVRHRFLYYIGEEHNTDVVGVGKGIAAWAIDEERVERILAMVREMKQ